MAVTVKKGAYRVIKRLGDLVVSVILLAVFLPILVVVAVLIKLDSPGPIIYKQTRTGLRGRLFTLYKFRTMTEERDADGKLLPNEQRLTRVGRFLRKTSLDELPQFVNVIKGDMSLVGPRPLLPEYLERYSPRQARRHEVKPGITGWAQVNGRNAISWEQKFELDVYYVEHCSLLFDLKVALLTLPKTFRAEGISAEGEATTRPFLGSADKGEML